MCNLKQYLFCSELENLIEDESVNWRFDNRDINSLGCANIQIGDGGLKNSLDVQYSLKGNGLLTGFLNTSLKSIVILQ